MPVTSNPQQLLLVKQLYEDGCLLAAREDDVSLTKAIILVDLAIEQMLNQVLRDFYPDFDPTAAAGRRDVNWGRLWQLAAQTMTGKGFTLLHYRELSSLHEIRNLAQHNGSVPTQAEVKRYIQPSDEMLSGVFKDAYGQDFHSFMLWDLVPNEGLRQLLRDSEYALGKGHPDVCIVGCNHAHGLIIAAIRRYTKLRRFRGSSVFPRDSGRRPSYPAGFPIEARSQIERAAKQIDGEIRKGVAQFRKEIMEEIEFLEDEVVTIGVGMPLMDTRRFQKIGSEFFIAPSYGGITIAKAEEESEPEEIARGARFMLNYLSRLVRLVDEPYPGVLVDIEVAMPLREQEFWKGVEGEVSQMDSA